MMRPRVRMDVMMRPRVGMEVMMRPRVGMEVMMRPRVGMHVYTVSQNYRNISLINMLIYITISLKHNCFELPTLISNHSRLLTSTPSLHIDVLL